MKSINAINNAIIYVQYANIGLCATGQTEKNEIKIAPFRVLFLYRELTAETKHVSKTEKIGWQYIPPVLPTLLNARNVRGYLKC